MTYEEGHVEFDNIEAVQNVNISNEGKIWGLTKYKGRGGYLVIPSEVRIKEGYIYFSKEQSTILKKLIDQRYVKDEYKDLKKKYVDFIMEHLNNNKIPIEVWHKVFDAINNGKEKLSEKERRIVMPIYHTLDKNEEKFREYIEKSVQKMLAFEDILSVQEIELYICGKEVERDEEGKQIDWIEVESELRKKFLEGYLKEFQKEALKDDSERDYEKLSMMPVHFTDHLMRLINEARERDMR